MILARAVRNERGELLLNEGIELTETYLQLLQQNGIQAAYVNDPATDDIDMHGVISESVRHTVTNDLCRLFDRLDAFASSVRGKPATVIASEIDASGFGEDNQEAESYTLMTAGIEAVINEVCGLKTLAGIQALRMSDAYQFDHAIDSTAIAVLIGERLRLPRERLIRIAAGCLMHDVGMIFCNPAILATPGPLTPDQMDIVRRHPELGFNLLRKLRPDAGLDNQAALQHHEKQDGSGYPNGRRGTTRVARSNLDHTVAGRILLDAEIIAVADVYDALGRDRPFRPAFRPDRVARMMRRLAGTHLNREIVTQFLAIVPVYPLGASVEILSGTYERYRGVVSAINPEHLNQPTIRVLFAPTGEAIEPVELDMTSDPAILSCTSLRHGADQG